MTNFRVETFKVEKINGIPACICHRVDIPSIPEVVFKEWKPEARPAHFFNPGAGHLNQFGGLGSLQDN